ncbi:MAG: lytic transglycosylase domain-containing protein [Thermodesulfobacteriota bacterium]
MLLILSACATPADLTQLPRLPKKEAAVGLIPQEYLCPGVDPAEAPDPQLVREIHAFLEENGMLGGMPAGLAGDLPLVLNGPVRSYLRVFTTSQKAIFETYLSRSGRYLPMIRRVFREQGLPQDLVYLALVESGFSPRARSHAGAVGLWQFIEGTGRRYGLKVDQWVDERRDPEKATRAAAHYLKDLHRQFGCWYLAAAGYNAGEKRVQGVVDRYATRDFWVMAQKKLLPQETCNYVPQLIAASLIAKNPRKYGFTQISYLRPWSYEPVKVAQGTDLRRFAESLGISCKDLMELNPELNQAQAPGDRQEYPLKIMVQKKNRALRLARVGQKQKPGIGARATERVASND